MKDTSEEILNMQHAIFFSKPEEQRFLLAMKMIDDGIELSKASIRNEDPTLTEKELKSELFKKIYSNDFSEDECELISSHLFNH